MTVKTTRCGRFSRRTPCLLGILALALVPPMCGGCAAAPRRAAGPDHWIIAGWDTSGSNRRRLAAEVRAGAGLIRRFEPSRTRLSCFRVDAVCTEFFDNLPPEGLERLLGMLVKALREPALARGTKPAPFWTAAAERAEEAACPTLVIYHTDGEIDDHSPVAMRALRAAVARLAANPRVRRVALWGVTPASRAELRREFAPLGDRLEIRGEDDMNAETLEAGAR